MMMEYVGNNGRVTDCTAIVLMGEKYLYVYLCCSR